MEHSRDEATEAIMGEIIAQVLSLHRLSTTPMVRKDGVKKRAMFMMAPVTH